MKKIEFRGDALERIREFPEAAKQATGFQLHCVQSGCGASDEKPLPDIGKGVREIRVSADDGWFRTAYVAALGDRVFVLHAWQKKSNQIAKKDKALLERRYKDLVAEIDEQKRRAKRLEK